MIDAEDEIKLEGFEYVLQRILGTIELCYILSFKILRIQMNLIQLGQFRYVYSFQSLSSNVTLTWSLYLLVRMVDFLWGS